MPDEFPIPIPAFKKALVDRLNGLGKFEASRLLLSSKVTVTAAAATESLPGGVGLVHKAGFVLGIEPDYGAYHGSSEGSNSSAGTEILNVAWAEFGRVNGMEIVRMNLRGPPGPVSTAGPTEPVSVRPAGTIAGHSSVRRANVTGLPELTIPSRAQREMSEVHAVLATQARENTQWITTPPVYESHGIGERKVDKPKTDIEIFISHSNHDKILGAALVTLIKATIEIPSDPNRIRFSSDNEHSFEIGKATDDAMRVEATGCKVFLAVVSKAAVESDWVLFEIGARWGAGGEVWSVMHPHDEFAILPGLLKRVQAYAAGDDEQMVMLIEALHEATGYKKARSQVTVQRAVKAFMAVVAALPKDEAPVVARSTKPAKTATASTHPSEDSADEYHLLAEVLALALERAPRRSRASRQDDLLIACKEHGLTGPTAAYWIRDAIDRDLLAWDLREMPDRFSGELESVDVVFITDAGVAFLKGRPEVARRTPVA